MLVVHPPSFEGDGYYIMELGLDESDEVQSE